MAKLGMFRRRPVQRFYTGPCCLAAKPAKSIAMAIVTKPARSPPPHLRRYTAGVFADLARRTRYVDPALIEAWPALVGAEIAGLCRPGRLSGGRTGRTLELIAPNGAAAARVQFEAEAIRRRLNDYLGPGAIGHISLRQSASGQPGEVRLAGALARFRASILEKSRDS